MRRAAWVIVPVVVVGLLAVAAFVVRAPGPATAFSLSVGQCFDIPTDAEVGDVDTLDCSAAHDAEVFVARAVTAPVPSADGAYPGDAAYGSWVGANCGDAAQRAYLGPAARADLAVGYFYPDANAWAHGERRVTCYLHTLDGSRLTAPLAGAGASAGASPSGG